MLDINKLTFGEIKEIQALINPAVPSTQSDSHWKIGKHYFIRTVTMYYIGKLRNVTDKELLLVDASWIADTGRFHDALKSGELNEVEPFINDVIIGRGAIVDASEWDHVLPNVQK
jgi:hypothetical protein